MDFDATEEQASEHGIRNGSILETTPHILGHSSCFPASGWRWHFSHRRTLQNSKRRSLKQWPGGGSWIWVQVGQCIGSLVEDVLFCGNALIKTFYCFLLHQKVAVKLLSKLRTCGTAVAAVASKTWATTGGQHSSWTKVRWTVGQWGQTSMLDCC